MSGQFCRRCADPVNPQDQFCERCGLAVVVSPRDRVEVDLGVAAGVSDRGCLHHRNEDALALRIIPRGLVPHGVLTQGVGPERVTVAIVCDGVSSSSCPDEASEAAAEAAADALVAALRGHTSPVVATREAVHAADRAVSGLADAEGADPAGFSYGAPACTFVSAIVTGDEVTIGWVGDSRAYWIPQAHTDSTRTQLTSDDSWLMEVLSAGTMTPDQAAADRRAHAITAWLGADADQLDPHIITIKPAGPGVVVVCSDGLWNYLDTVEELAAALLPQALDAPLDAARRLVQIALHRGGHDNITVAVVPFGNPPNGSRVG